MIFVAGNVARNVLEESNADSHGLTSRGLTSDVAFGRLGRMQKAAVRHLISCGYYLNFDGL